MRAIAKLSVGVLLVCLIAVPANAQIIINEVLGSTASSDREFIELWNSGSSAVDLTGWRIELWDSDLGRCGSTDAQSPYIIPNAPNSVLAAGDYYTFINGLAQFQYGVVGDFVLPSNSIENSAYTMILRDNNGAVVQSVYFDDGFTLPNDGPHQDVDCTPIDPCIFWGPDGRFLPAGFFRICDGSSTAGLLLFNQPSPRATPDASNGTCVDLDIKPGSCPNAYNRTSHGNLPVSILGSAGFDVADIDIATVTMRNSNEFFPNNFGSIGASNFLVEDTGTPDADGGPCGDACDCHDAEEDGTDDLSMHFDTDALVLALELDVSEPGDDVALVIQGQLLDGTPFAGADCVRLVPKAKPPGLVDLRSGFAGAYFTMTPSDVNADDGDFGNFQRSFSQGTQVTYTFDPAASINPEVVSGAKRLLGWYLDGAFQGPAISGIVTVDGDYQLLQARFIAAGDLNDDGSINLLDFSILANCFGTEPGGSASCSLEMHAAADMDRNGSINLNDFAGLAQYFGTAVQSREE